MSPPPPETLYLLTLNCGRLPQHPTALSAALTPTLPSTPPTLLLLSLQEIAPLAPSFLGGHHLTAYLTALTTAIALSTTTAYSTPYTHLSTHTHGLTALLIFTPPTLPPPITEWASIGLGLASMGNKGAIAVRLSLSATTTITAVAAHWAPDEFRALRRDQDWEAAVKGLVFADGSGIFAPRSHLFVFGDLNYRTGEARPDAGTRFPDPAAPPREWALLLEQDQLGRRRREGRTLHLLEEPPVRFAPTYKFVDGEGGGERFSDGRWPSWTDRVLYLPRRGVEVMEYGSVPEYRGSDHKPVFAVFRVGEVQEGEEEFRAPWGVEEEWMAKRELVRRGEVLVGSAMMTAESVGVWGVVLTLVLAVLAGTWAWRGFGGGEFAGL